ncbi:hypothetical protein V6N12_010130 [Hibiscus sabdariffa]|uniref:Uncharacterized protein n=1 Tax=Hibiscus sabdariffa TaxID=183260 RepID=A0ABR2EEJ2_9ROSI
MIAFKLEDETPKRTEIGASDVHSTLMQKTCDKGLHIKTVLYNSLMRAYNKVRNFDTGRTLFAKGSNGDNVLVGRFISLIEFYLTLLRVDLEFRKKGTEVLSIIVN